MSAQNFLLRALIVIRNAKSSSRKVKEIAKKFHAEVDFIPQAGHLINYETPEKIAELVLPKLKN